MATQGSPFTAFTGTDTPNSSAFASIMASLQLGSSTSILSASSSIRSASVAATASASASVSTISPSQSNPTTLATVASSLRPSNSSTATMSGSANTAASNTNSAMSTATNEASSSNGSLTNSESCNSISCSPGLQAAIAVPIVVVVLAVVGLMLFFARRRKSKSRSASHTSGSITEKPNKKKKSLDSKLLVGGRYSSNNSTNRKADTSMNSVGDDVPPYKDPVHLVPASLKQNEGILATGGVAAPSEPRPDSSTSAPPPYGQTESRRATQVRSPVIVVNNPFADVSSNSASPVEGASPFRDPSATGESVHNRPGLSRASSLVTGVQPDDGSILAESDAGSIREAQVGRHVSVASSGRVANIRHSGYIVPNSIHSNASS